MASELSLNVQFNFSKDPVSLSFSANGAFDVTGDKYERKVVNIGITDETISKGDMASLGYVVIKNLDDTNFIKAGDDGTNYPITLLPEEFAMFRITGTDLHLIADTAPCDVELTLVEE